MHWQRQWLRHQKKPSARAQKSIIERNEEKDEDGEKNKDGEEGGTRSKHSSYRLQNHTFFYLFFCFLLNACLMRSMTNLSFYVNHFHLFPLFLFSHDRWSAARYAFGRRFGFRAALTVHFIRSMRWSELKLFRLFVASMRRRKTQNANTESVRNHQLDECKPFLCRSSSNTPNGWPTSILAH